MRAILLLLLFSLSPFAVDAQSQTQAQAVRAFDVYDSVGINTHWTFGKPYVYLNDFPQLIAAMQKAHIYHFRDGEWGNGSNTQPWVTSMYTQLNASGLKADLIIAKENQTLQQLETDLKKYPGLEAIEAMNEWDMNGGAGWVDSLKAKLPIIRQAGIDLHLPVIGPSLVQASSFARPGDISQYLTFGNVHDYQGNRNPETTGWGGGINGKGHGYGSILWNVDMAQQYAPGRPVWSTETGLQTTTTNASQRVPESVQGAYIPRLFLAHYKHGIQRTYLYQLVDDPWSSYGLLRIDLSPKPGYTALSNLQNILQDAPKRFAPGALNYSLSGNTAGLDSLLIQKSNGTFLLALWLNQSIWNTEKGTATPVQPQPVRVTIQTAGMQGTSIDSFHPDGTVTSSSLSSSSFTVSANSCVTLVRIDRHGK